MKPPMRHTAYKITTTKNAYGDYIANGTTSLICHFRYITDITVNTDNLAVQSDAMAWFEPDSGIVKNDLVTIDGEHFRIERVTKARRLRDPTVQFLKCDLQKYGLIS